MIVGRPRELTGCCLGTTSLKAGSAQFLEALLHCPRLPAGMIVYQLCLLIKSFKNALLLVVLEGKGESHFLVAPGFPLGPGRDNWELVRDLNVHEVR